MRIFIIIIILSTCWSCSTPNVEPNEIYVLGHGGEGFNGINTLYAPNSVGSITRALDFYNLDGVEVDAQFTADGEIIIYHDIHMENSTQCKGRVNDLTIDETAGCFYKKQFKNKYEQEVITLDSFISLLNEKWSEKYITINVQAHFKVPFRIDTLANFYHRKIVNVADRRFFSTECADANFLFYLRLNDLSHTCFLVADVNEGNVRDVNRFGLQGLVTSFDKRNETLEKELHLSQKKIYLYGQKTTRDYKKYDYRFVSGVQVDNPILALKYFKDQ